jgi:chromosome segregation ATPase
MASSDMPSPERVEVADGHDPAYVRALEIEVYGLRERVVELETELDRKDEALAETECRLDRTESELERIRRELGDCEDELADREEELTDREEELAERESELADATEWAEFLDEELRVQRDRVESLEARVESWRTSAPTPGTAATASSTAFEHCLPDGFARGRGLQTPV